MNTLCHSKKAKRALLKVEHLSLAWEEELFPSNRGAVSALGRPSEREGTLDLVVEDVSFEVFSGERLCICGKSGVGKSTLFHGIAGLLPPVSRDGLRQGSVGKILLWDKTLGAYVGIAGTPGHVAYMFQDDLLFEEKTILESCALPALLRGRASRQEVYEKVGQLLPAFGLAEAASKYPHELSGGMRQRAALLRTAMQDAPLVLMDEPFSALDDQTKQEVQAFFLSMIEDLGWTIIFISHSTEEAHTFATRTLYLTGTPARLQ